MSYGHSSRGEDRQEELSKLRKDLKKDPMKRGMMKFNEDHGGSKYKSSDERHKSNKPK